MMFPYATQWSELCSFRLTVAESRPRKNHIAGITSTMWRNMSTHRHRILALLVASICLVGIYLVVPEPEVRSDSGSILLRAGVSADPGTSVDVAKYYLQRGEVVEYSFEASGTVKFMVFAAVIDPDMLRTPLVTWLKVTAMSASDSITPGFHGVFYFVFANPSETSDVELTVHGRSPFSGANGSGTVRDVPGGGNWRFWCHTSDSFQEMAERRCLLRATVHQ